MGVSDGSTALGFTDALDIQTVSADLVFFIALPAE